MEEMKRWRASQKAQASSIAAAIANTEMREQVIAINEKRNVKKEVNLDDALLR